MSASNKQIAVSQLKEVEKELEGQLAGVRAALAALGAVAAKAPKGKGKVATIPRKRAGGMTPGIQAALDARAVKSGKATPEQIDRYNKRLAEKAAKTTAVPEGASLAEAAAS